MKRMATALGLAVVLIAPSAYADEALIIAQDLASKWTADYNSSDPAKLADLYTQDAVWNTAQGIWKSKAEIEEGARKAIENAKKQNWGKLTTTPLAAHKNGDVIWSYGDVKFAEGPSGHYSQVAVTEGGSWRIALSANNLTPKQQ